MKTQALTNSARIVAPDMAEIVPFEEKLALLLLTAADGNRALAEEAIRTVADEGVSTLPEVLNYIYAKEEAYRSHDQIV